MSVDESVLAILSYQLWCISQFPEIVSPEYRGMNWDLRECDAHLFSRSVYYQGVYLIGVHEDIHALLPAFTKR